MAITVLPLLLILLTAACGGKSEAADRGRGSKAGGPPRAVSTAEVVQMPLGQSVTVNGTLDVYERAIVGTKVAGRLETLPVDIGTAVRKGQVIARVAPPDYQIRVQQAEAALAQASARIGGSDQRATAQTGVVRSAAATLDEARRNRDRGAELLRDGVISRSEFDRLEAAYRVADSRYQDSLEEVQSRRAVVSERRAELSMARQQLSDTALYAPFSGVVQQRQATVGEFLQAGAPVAELVRINPLRFRAEVPERDAASLQVGQTLRLTIDGSGREYTARVARMSPALTASRVLLMEADVPNDGSLRPGGFASATITTNVSERVTVIPSDALVTFAGIQKVITVKDGKAKEKTLTIGRRTPEWIEVVKGVEPGEQVVLKPGNLQTGQAVRVSR